MDQVWENGKNWIGGIRWLVFLVLFGCAGVTGGGGSGQVSGTVGASQIAGTGEINSPADQAAGPSGNVLAYQHAAPQQSSGVPSTQFDPGELTNPKWGVASEEYSLNFLPKDDAVSLNGTFIRGEVERLSPGPNPKLNRALIIVDEKNYRYLLMPLVFESSSSTSASFEFLQPWDVGSLQFFVSPPTAFKSSFGDPNKAEYVFTKGFEGCWDDPCIPHTWAPAKIQARILKVLESD